MRSHASPEKAVYLNSQTFKAENFTLCIYRRTMADKPIILWFRRDLRLADHPALDAAALSGAPIIPVYILDDETPGHWRPGGEIGRAHV